MHSIDVNSKGISGIRLNQIRVYPNQDAIDLDLNHLTNYFELINVLSNFKKEMTLHAGSPDNEISRSPSLAISNVVLGIF